MLLGQQSMEDDDDDDDDDDLIGLDCLDAAGPHVLNTWFDSVLAFILIVNSVHFDA